MRVGQVISNGDLRVFRKLKFPQYKTRYFINMISHEYFIRTIKLYLLRIIRNKKEINKRKNNIKWFKKVLKRLLKYFWKNKCNIYWINEKIDVLHNYMDNNIIKLGNSIRIYDLIINNKFNKYITHNPNNEEEETLNISTDDDSVASDLWNSNNTTWK